MRAGSCFGLELYAWPSPDAKKIKLDEGAKGAEELKQETVTVVGVRQSQIKAIEVKRLADSIQDSISAESIGQLPDVTITDALQRITGVQINRDGGVGSSVAVRGLPEVGTMLNGEVFITPDQIDSPQPDFTTLPATLFNQVDVIKSPTAAQTLRKLLSEIRRVASEIVAVRKSSEELSAKTNKIYDAVKGIRELIDQAATTLTMQTTGRRSASVRKTVVRQIDDAIGAINGLEQMYFTALASLPAQSKAKCEDSVGPNPPSVFLRDYLSATKELIQEELARGADEGDETGLFIKAALRPAPDVGYFKLYSLVSQILEQPLLIQNTVSRCIVGTALLRPLVKYRGDKRINEFKTALSKLYPEGPNDDDDKTLTAAAKKLNTLLERIGS